jgi:hypothetical protein
MKCEPKAAANGVSEANELDRLPAQLHRGIAQRLARVENNPDLKASRNFRAETVTSCESATCTLNARSTFHS